MATEKETTTQKFSETLFILAAFNLIFLLEKKRQGGKPKERIGGCIFEQYVM